LIKANEILIEGRLPAHGARDKKFEANASQKNDQLVEPNQDIEAPGKEIEASYPTIGLQEENNIHEN
jgi:hypothetical protein